MIDTKKIVWLASYPKSGNTWFRVFLTNLLSDKKEAADINNLLYSPIASSRSLFDDATGLNSSELTSNEIQNLRPEVYNYIASKSKEIIYFKIHDAYTFSSLGIPLINHKITKAVLYFIRNPLDVAVSFAHHSNVSMDKMVKIMADENYAFCYKTDKLHLQLEQKLLSWSNHVNSWVNQSKLPILVIRYEDMQLNNFETFKKAVQFIGLKHTDNQIEKALQLSNFKEMQKQEKEKGFSERSPKSNIFFRKGIIGSWKEELSELQVKKICSNHRDMMIKFGYLNDNNNIL